MYVPSSIFFELMRAVNKTENILAFCNLVSRKKADNEQYKYKYILYQIMIVAKEKKIKQRKDGRYV